MPWGAIAIDARAALQGDAAAEILGMADMLSDGIVAQFPRRF